MAVKHKPFKALHTTLIAIRNDTVRAIRVTERNYESVAEWCGGVAWAGVYKKADGELITVKTVRVKTPRGVRVARVGDFVIRNDEVKGKKLRNNHIGKSRWFVGKDDVFEAGFEEVK